MAVQGTIAQIGFFLSLLCTVGFVFTTAYHEWRRNSAQSSEAFLSQVYLVEGLWVRCNSAFPGQIVCDTYDVALIGIPPELQAMRALMCLASLFSLLAMFCAAMILPCTNVAGRMKTIISRVGGVLLLLAGGMCLGAVSWYAANIIFEFFRFEVIDNRFKYEFGSALYVGWISSGLAIIAGALLLCCSCGNEDDADESYRYTYKPPQSNKPNAARSAEYV